MDFTNWGELEICKFFDGFVTTTGTDGYYLTYSYNYPVYRNSSTVNQIRGGLLSAGLNFVTFAVGQGWTRGTINRSIGFTGSKIVQDKIIDMLGYVSSNNAEEYLNNGEQNGYWYELIT